MTFVLGVFSLAGCQPPKCNWLYFPVHVRPPEPGQLRRQASGDRQLRAQLRNPIECSQPQNICGGDPTPPDQLTCSRVICTLGLSVTDSATTQSEPAHETPARGPSSAAADQPAKPAGAVAAAIPGPFPCLSHLLSSPRLGRAAASMATSSAEVNPWRCRVPTPSL